jgi:hypothetical protein
MRINLIGKKILLFKWGSFTIEVGVQERKKDSKIVIRLSLSTNDIYKKKKLSEKN